MKRIFLTIALILSPMLASAQDVASIDSAVECVRGATVVVQTSSGHGSGTVVNHKDVSYVITAWHVISDNFTYKKIAVDGELKSFKEKGKLTVTQRWLPELDKETVHTYTAELVDLSPELDIAILKIIGKTSLKYSIKIGWDHKPVIGEKVLHAGAMQRPYHHNMLTTGTITQASLDNVLSFGPKFMDVCNASWYPGSSGGGVFTANGEYIGLAVQWRQLNISIYSPIRHLKKWLLEDCKMKFIFQNDDSIAVPAPTPIPVPVPRPNPEDLFDPFGEH